MATSKCTRIYTKKVDPGADCCAAEFCGGGGHPCQGLVPPRATWPSSRSGPADTVRPEFAANTALMYGGRPAGGNGQGVGYCSTGGACRRQGTHLQLATCCCREETQHQHQLLFQLAKALDYPAGRVLAGKSLGW